MSELQLSPVVSDQPAPQPGDRKVSDLLQSIYRSGRDELDTVGYRLVAQDVLLRLQTGEQKYGSTLMTFNGRSADLDLYQELCDSIAYLTQKIFETSEVELALSLMDDVELIYQVAARCRKRLVEAGILWE